LGSSRMPATFSTVSTQSGHSAAAQLVPEPHFAGHKSLL
jgi:hypothetical protein